MNDDKENTYLHMTDKCKYDAVISISNGKNPTRYTLHTRESRLVIRSHSYSLKHGGTRTLLSHASGDDSAESSLQAATVRCGAEPFTE